MVSVSISNFTCADANESDPKFLLFSFKIFAKEFKILKLFAIFDLFDLSSINAWACEYVNDSFDLITLFAKLFLTISPSFVISTKQLKASLSTLDFKEH